MSVASAGVCKFVRSSSSDSAPRAVLGASAVESASSRDLPLVRLGPGGDFSFQLSPREAADRFAAIDALRGLFARASGLVGRVVLRRHGDVRRGTAAIV
ncbi:MAG: hypothetical protein JSR77_15380 [Planctomycetes bacterium]|nr:hypothetical protein [Planctomycetota bacterium]